MAPTPKPMAVFVDKLYKVKFQAYLYSSAPLLGGLLLAILSMSRVSTIGRKAGILNVQAKKKTSWNHMAIKIRNVERSRADKQKEARQQRVLNAPVLSKKRGKSISSFRNRKINATQSSLLHEYDARYRSAEFVDRRIGETDANKSLEDKMFERFTREKQRALSVRRRGLYNLNGVGLTFDPSMQQTLEADVEEEEESGGGFVLTHGGRALPSDEQHHHHHKDVPLSDFDDLSDTDHDHGTIESHVVAQHHFGGSHDADDDHNGDDDDAVDEASKRKSRLEVMKEVMQKAKFHKYERQRERAENDELRDALNADFDAIVGSLLFDKTDKPEKLAKTTNNTEKTENTAGMGKAPQLQDFDVLVRQLGRDGKPREAKAQDRLKTADELALEARNELLRLDRLRQQSHAAAQDSLHAVSDIDAPDSTDSSGQDSDDSVIDTDTEDDVVDLSDEHEDLCEAGNEDADDHHRRDLVDQGHGLTSRVQPPPTPVAFVYDMPVDHFELLLLFGNHTLSDRLLILDRLATLFHPSIDPGNKALMMKLLIIVIEHLVFSLVGLTSKTMPVNFLPVTQPDLPSHVRGLWRFVRTWIVLLPSSSKLLRDFFLKKLSIFAAAASVDSRQCWRELLVLTHVAFNLFAKPDLLSPPQDVKHAVLTPLTLVLSLLIAKRSSPSLSSSSSSSSASSASSASASECLIYKLYLVKLLLQFQPYAFYPEILHFLASQPVNPSKEDDHHLVDLLKSLDLMTILFQVDAINSFNFVASLKAKFMQNAVAANFSCLSIIADVLRLPLSPSPAPFPPLTYHANIILKQRTLPLLTPVLTLDPSSSKTRKDPLKSLKKQYSNEFKGAVKALKKDARQLAIHKRQNNKQQRFHNPSIRIIKQ